MVVEFQHNFLYLFNGLGPNGLVTVCLVTSRHTYPTHSVCGSVFSFLYEKKDENLILMTEISISMAVKELHLKADIEEKGW